MVMHSRGDDGRHWLTTLDFPPMQLLPVAANHCRVGHFLARVISARLASAPAMPEELVLTRADVDRLPEVDGEAGEVRVRLEMRSAPADTEGADIDADDPVAFVTPLPPSDWTGDYDSWIHTAGRRLGLDAPPPRGPAAYDGEMAAAAAEVQRRLPGLRERHAAGLGDLKMGLKIGLPTRRGGREFVWVLPLAWPGGGRISCRLESEPRDCEGYRHGQTLDIAETDVVDYIIGSEASGVVDPGLSERIAENYGLIIS
jgi:hypothetical protein